jgi:hypothetical protein
MSGGITGCETDNDKFVIGWRRHSEQVPLDVNRAPLQSSENSAPALSAT